MNLDLLERFVREGTLILHIGDEQHRFGNGLPVAGMRLQSASVVNRILRNPQVNLGETYLAGDWQVAEGTLHDLLSVLRRNLERQLAEPGRARLPGILLQSWNGLSASRRNVSHHYNLDEDLFRACLDAQMHYSCAYFRDPDMSLEAAQHAKSEHIARKLCLRPGMRVLDIGCGWGSLAQHLAEHHDVFVTGLTLSEEQLRVARQSVAMRGLGDRVELRLEDYRLHGGVYDRIVSVGMFEHVGRRNYRRFFRAVAQMLNADGVAVLHTIANSGPPAPVSPWIRRHIFPGGYIPSLSDMAPQVEKARLVSTDIEVLRRHYALTLREWQRRFQRQRERFVASHGETFCRMWEFYLVSSQTAFEVGDLVVLQWQLARHNLGVPVTRDYLYGDGSNACRNPLRAAAGVSSRNGSAA
ncbi:MAG: cyclopropane-fatty-acyl-phospholipid synthase family protein [Pseudomonadales bacterium]